MTIAELLEAQYNSLLPDSRRRYDYQIEVGRQLLEGQNVVLHAPTGCGKTLAVLAPFLVGRREGRWRRLIYALPLRSLANGIYETAKEVAKPEGCHVTLQTGEQPDDPFFDIGDVIVTTYDQVLSGLLCSPYGLGTRLNNINAAAVAGALVVFDEFHLMEASRAFLTAAATLHLFSELSQSAWLTATATSSLVEILSDALHAVSLQPSEQEIVSLPCVKKVDRRLLIEESPLTARRILECHTGRTLVVTNQVRWAQDLFLDLERLAPHMPMLLLHSLFFRQDRASKEEQMRRWFGPEGQAEGIIVATQVVEAGLDLTCDQLHTTICPMNAFVQRAGRNARFPPDGDNLARGQVHVYPLPDGSEPWRPYDRRLVDHTWELLSQHDGAHLAPGTLAGWVESIHAAADQEELGQGWVHRFRDCITKISRNSIQGQHDEIASLIREVPNVRVVLDTSPPEQPLERDGFSVSRRQIKRLIERLEGAEGVWGWRAGESDEARWQPLLRSEDVADHYLLCLAPVVAAYDDRCGLRLGERGNAVSPERTIPERPGYQGLGKEPWIDHSRNVAACIKARLTRELAEHSMLARGFARRYSLSQEEVAAAVVACAQLHDFGKLRAQWQRWVEAYQQAKEVGYAHARALAHTDYDSRAWADRELSRQITAQTGPRGPHAAPGAYIARILLLGMLHPQSAPSMQLILCALGAILGHHGGWLGGEDQGDLEAGPLWHGWQTELHQLLGATIDHSTVQAVEGELGAQERRRRLGKVLDRVASAEALPDTWPLLAYLTRTLRLSDQKATEEGSDGA